MKALALLHVSLPVSDLARLAVFYADALGFAADGPAAPADPATARLLGARSVRTLRLRRGRQVLELAEFDPPGAPYPTDGRSCDLWFQHCALVTSDIAAAHARLAGRGASPISRDGPQALPGGIVAFKFRDPDGHPMELIRFPEPNPATLDGIDHSAICVADADRSIAFYADALGLRVASRQVNAGPAQDAMDGLQGISVDVVGLAPARPDPHVELLGYRSPAGRAAPATTPADLAASRLVFLVDSLDGREDAVATPDGRAALARDPDGHLLHLVERPG